MDSLCLACGAYWDCEHRPAWRGEEVAPDAPSYRDRHGAHDNSGSRILQPPPAPAIAVPARPTDSAHITYPLRPGVARIRLGHRTVQEWERALGPRPVDWRGVGQQLYQGIMDGIVAGLSAIHVASAQLADVFRAPVINIASVLAEMSEQIDTPVRTWPRRPSVPPLFSRQERAGATRIEERTRGPPRVLLFLCAPPLIGGAVGTRQRAVQTAPSALPGDAALGTDAALGRPEGSEGGTGGERGLGFRRHVSPLSGPRRMRPTLPLRQRQLRPRARRYNPPAIADLLSDGRPLQAGR